MGGRRRRPITPEDVVEAAECMHTWYLKCHSVSAKRAARRRPLPESQRQRQEAADQAFAALARVARVAWDGRDWREGHRTTLSLMKQRPLWIYRPALVRDDVRGESDFLLCGRSRSRLGAWSYEPVVIARESKVTHAHRLELEVMAYLLEPVLGHPPKRGSAWLANGHLATVWLEDISRTLRRMRKIRLEGRRPRLRHKTPCETCRWRAGCDRCQ